MKNILLLANLLMLSLSIHSQYYFQTTIGSSNYSECAYSVLELANGDFLITNDKYFSSSLISSPYLVKISKNGAFINDNFIEDATVDFFYVSILTFNSKILVVGILPNQYGNYSDSLIISELDTNLNTNNTYKIHFFDSLRTGNIVVSNVKDSMLLISGYYDKINNYHLYHSFVSYLDTNYAIIKKETDIVKRVSTEELSNLKYNKQDSSWYSYIVLNKWIGHKVRFRNDLHPDSVFMQDSFDMKQPVFIESVKSNNFLISSTKNNKVKLYKLNTIFDTISSRVMGKNITLNYPSVNRSLSANSKFLYAGITEGLNPNNIWWGMQNSNYYVAKFDSSGNKIWDKRIGSNGYYYMLYDVLATKDGGCLLSGNVYDYTSNTFQKDIFIVKLDSNGTTTWIKDIKFPQSEVSLYPNPVRDILSVELKSKNQNIKDYRIIDLQGKIIYSGQSRTGQFKLDVSNLASGIYIFHGESSNGIVFRRRFIKY